MTRWTSLLSIWLLASTPAAAAPQPAGEAKPGSWSVGTVLEPESVEEVRAARVEGPGGFLFAVAREPGGGRVLGILRLPPSDQDMLDEGRSVQLQIDQGKRFEPPRVGGGLKSITFFLWDGMGEPVLGTMRDLMEAREKIRIQYPLAGGGYKLIDVAAAEVKPAIAAALDVAPEVTPEALALATARQEAIDRCFGETRSKERDRCLERLAGCKDAASADALRSCLASAKK